MASRNENWQHVRTRGWADEVDEEWRSSGELTSPVYNESGHQYRSADGVWHEDINVQRGQSQQRLDLDSGFMRTIRQNQYARDEHEQAWQDAYSNAPPFQQKWGVGVDVQPPRRGDERQWQHLQASRGMTRREEQPEAASERPWWRKAADIPHSSEVRILSRSEAERRAMPSREPEPIQDTVDPVTQGTQVSHEQHSSASAVSHEVLEAQLLRCNRARAEAQHSTHGDSQGPRMNQPGLPAIDSQGIAMGIPVDWALGPAAPSMMLQHNYREPQGQDVFIPEARSCALASAPCHVVQHVELAGKLAKQEQVKMGFQLYRPPTILAKASSEEPSEKKEKQDTSEQHRANSNSNAVHALRHQSARNLPQEDATPAQAAVYALRAVTKAQREVPLNRSMTRASGRDTAKLPRQDKSKSPLPHPQQQIHSSSAAGIERIAEVRLTSSISNGRQRNKPAASDNTGSALCLLDASSKLSNRTPANGGAMRSPPQPTKRLSNRRKQSSERKRQPGDGASQASKDAPAQPRSQPADARPRGAKLRSQNALEQLTAAEQRAQETPAQQRHGRNRGANQCSGSAFEQQAAPRIAESAGSTAQPNSSEQRTPSNAAKARMPKQLLTELVKEAAVYNASSEKVKPRPVQTNPKATSRSATAGHRDRGTKLSAPPGLEGVIPTDAARR